MKTWNTPEIAELNIAETANGLVDHYYESKLIPIMNDSKKEEQTPDPDPVDDPS